MRALYSLFTWLVWCGLQVIAPFHQKLGQFVRGRKKTFGVLEDGLNAPEKTIWMHVASLGEYEQGLPLLERLKKEYPTYKLILTFFSPSGFEVKKDRTPADIVLYLPMDTRANAKRFVAMVRPQLALFIKYEIWPNILHQLKKKDIPTFLVSGIFSKRQVYFKWYGGFLRNSLKAFTHFFVQEVDSKQLLQSLGFENVTISGDTRFDRVAKIGSQDNTLPFMELFKGNSLCLVAGSTWPEDERILVDYINRSRGDMKFVIAPHNIKGGHMEALRNSLTKETALFSRSDATTLAQAAVLLVDTIGLLTKIYSYADLAYVGGGFATGLHNTLEPAVFGIPVIIGPQFSDFNEAIEMVQRKGVLVVQDPSDFETTMHRLIHDVAFLKSTGDRNQFYIEGNLGATQRIMQHIAQWGT